MRQGFIVFSGRVDWVDVVSNSADEIGGSPGGLACRARGAGIEAGAFGRGWSGDQRQLHSAKRARIAKHLFIRCARKIEDLPARDP